MNKKIIYGMLFISLMALNISVFVTKDGDISQNIGINQLWKHANADPETIDPKIPKAWPIACGTTTDPRTGYACAGDGNGCVPLPCN